MLRSVHAWGAGARPTVSRHVVCDRSAWRPSGNCRCAGKRRHMRLRRRFRTNLLGAELIVLCDVGASPEAYLLLPLFPSSGYCELLP